MKKESFYEEDFWSLENLAALIDADVGECSEDLGHEYIDSVNLKQNKNTNFFYASCTAVRKFSIYFQDKMIINKDIF